MGVYSGFLSLFVPHESHSILVQAEMSGYWVFVKHWKWVVNKWEFWSQIPPFKSKIVLSGWCWEALRQKLEELCIFALVEGNSNKTTWTKHGHKQPQPPVEIRIKVICQISSSEVRVQTISCDICPFLALKVSSLHQTGTICFKLQLK